MTYPIAEIFHSVQGEGFWTGTPMMFVRLAGCNVGRYDSAEDSTPFSLDKEAFKLFKEKHHSICTTFDGQRFLCDTDYHTSEKLTPEEIASQLNKELHVCITGGEPLLYDLNPLVQAFPVGVMIHVESSGTKPWKELDDETHPVWITCCPKEGFNHSFLDFVDEIKLLVGPNFKESEMAPFENFTNDLYLQPINGVHDVWQENLNYCLALLERHPAWKLSAQLHKYLEVR